MKQAYLLAVMMLAAVVCGCSKTNEKPVGKERVSVTASINPTTRASLSADVGGILKTQWGAGDVIGVYNPTAVDYATFEIDEISADGLTATFTGEIDTEGGQFYAVYGINGYVSDGTCTFRVADKGYFLTQDGNGDIAHLDNFVILHGSFTTQNTSVNFSHTLAFFKFTLTLPDGETLPDGGSATIELDVQTDNYPTMSIADGSYTMNGFTHDLRVFVSGLSSTEDGIVAYMAVFPSDASGRDLTLTLEVNDGQGSAKSYIKTIAAKPSRLIEAGKYYTITEQMTTPPVEPEGNVNPLVPEEF